MKILNQNNPNAILPEDRIKHPKVVFENCILIQSDHPFIYMDNDARVELIVRNNCFIHMKNGKYKIIRFLKNIKMFWSIS